MILRIVNNIINHQNRALLKKQNLLFETSKRFLLPSSQKMAEPVEDTFAGTSLTTILSRLTSFACLKLACSWDNVGLLVDPMSDSNIKNILLTNDLTEEVVEEASVNKCGLIVSYHPNIFKGLKRVTGSTWKERLVVQCIKNNIAVFSPHTSWDVVQGGVNDWLSQALPVNISVPIEFNETYPTMGAGRLCTLNRGCSVSEIIDLVKVHIGIKHLRLALGRNKNEDAIVNTVALCAGSGASVLGGVQADLYLTGEMLHHDVLEATQNHIHVILCNHSDSERGFLRYFQHKLQEEILKAEVKVIISAIDRDPLKTV